MWITVLIVVLVIYAIFKERQAFGCPTIPNCTDCNNQKGKAVIGTLPEEGDSPSDIYGKLRKAGSYRERMVTWRRSLIFSFFLCVFLWYILYQKFPGDYNLLVFIMVTILCIYMFDSFYNFHLHNHIKQNINLSVDYLEKLQ